MFRQVLADNVLMSLKSKRLRFVAATIGLLVVATSCGKGKGSIPGLKNFYAGILEARLYVSFVSTTLTWDGGLTLPVPGLPDSSVSFAPDLESAGTVFQFQAPLSSIVNAGKPLPLSGLPDGRPLPDVRTGQLPRWDFTVKNVTLSAYLSNDAFGLFVPLTFRSKDGKSLIFPVSVKIEDDRGNVLGRAHAIPSNIQSTGSGALVLLAFTGSPETNEVKP